MEDMKKYKISAQSLKMHVCLLDQKNTETLGENTILID